MILLVVFGGLLLILGIFYLINSWQQCHEWKWATFIVVVSLAMTVYGAINLPYWHHNSSNSQNTSSQQTQKTSNNSSSLSAFSNSGLQSQNSQNQENKEMAVLRQMQKVYTKLGNVDYDSSTKTYKIIPKDNDEGQAISQIVQNPSQASQEGWPNLTKSLINTSKQLKKVLGNGYSVSLMNPSDHSSAVYTVKDGQETYTAVNSN